MLFLKTCVNIISLYTLHYGSPSRHHQHVLWRYFLVFLVAASAFFSDSTFILVPQFNVCLGALNVSHSALSDVISPVTPGTDPGPAEPPAHTQLLLELTPPLPPAAGSCSGSASSCSSSSRYNSSGVKLQTLEQPGGPVYDQQQLMVDKSHDGNVSGSSSRFPDSRCPG